MRVAVLVKHVPRPDELRLADGRLVREGVELEVSAFCRRANAKAVELAGPDGEVVVFTMGPPTAAEALREMLACGATRGVHLCDPRFAGSDTLATARALAAAITAEGPFDLVLCGLNSLDADTGQVGPEVAELLGLPFAPGVRELELDGTHFRVRLETDDGHRSVEGALPVVLSTAERLCDPSKAGREERALVDDDRITTVGLDDLGLAADEVGPSGSPTIVGPVELHVSSRHGWRTSDVGEALRRLEDLGALAEGHDDAALDVVAEPTGGHHAIHCFLVPGPDGIAVELLGGAAHLAAQIGGTVTAIVAGPAPRGLGGAGADRVIAVPDAFELEQRVEAVAAIAIAEQPWALLFEATRDGRAVASAVAARCGWGLTGDAIGLEVSPAGRLVAWKPAFGGQLVAPIASRSPVQMATVRPGIMHRRTARPASDPAPEVVAVGGTPRLRTTGQVHDDPHVAELLRASVVIGVGTGVQPDEYPLLEPLQTALGGAALAASRKVTDRGWLPRSRQVGVTGHSIAPRLYVAIGIFGKLNHMIGVRAARTVLAINHDPTAAVFELADVGLVADWRVVVPELVDLLEARVLGPIGTSSSRRASWT
jgi:electron transfer flavoprotein alpha subunit